MIFLDMDGVLADFVQHTIDLKIPNNDQWFDPKDTWTEETWAGERVKEAAMHTPGFWLNIPIMPGGKKLWDFCNRWSPGYVSVLTCKPHKDSPVFIAEEKFQWINTMLGDLDRSRFFCVNHGEKKDYLKAYDILIDDDKRHFEGADGNAYFIHHSSTYEKAQGSIKMLKGPDVDATISEIESIYS